MLFVSGLAASSSQHYTERWQPFPPSGRSHFSILSVCPILEPALQDLPANQETTHCCLRDPGCHRKDLQVVIGLLEGGCQTESHKQELWQHQRQKLEEKDLKRKKERGESSDHCMKRMETLLRALLSGPPGLLTSLGSDPGNYILLCVSS